MNPRTLWRTAVGAVAPVLPSVKLRMRISAQTYRWYGVQALICTRLSDGKICAGPRRVGSLECLNPSGRPLLILQRTARHKSIGLAAPDLNGNRVLRPVPAD